MNEEQIEQYRQLLVRMSEQRIAEPSDLDDLVEAVDSLIDEVRRLQQAVGIARANTLAQDMAIDSLGTGIAAVTQERDELAKKLDRMTHNYDAVREELKEFRNEFRREYLERR